MSNQAISEAKYSVKELKIMSKFRVYVEVEERTATE